MRSRTIEAPSVAARSGRAVCAEDKLTRGREDGVAIPIAGAASSLREVLDLHDAINRSRRIDRIEKIAQKFLSVMLYRDGTETAAKFFQCCQKRVVRGSALLASIKSLCRR